MAWGRESTSYATNELTEIVGRIPAILFPLIALGGHPPALRKSLPELVLVGPLVTLKHRLGHLPASQFAQHLPRTLTAAFVRSIGRPGVYGDGRGGRGLSLRVHRTATGRITKTWRQRVRIEGRLTSIGLGPYPEVTLAEARQKALDNSRMVLLGQDPRGRGVPTFAEAAERTIELHRNSWKAGSPLAEQWASTFRLHAAPLMDKLVDRITSGDVLRCLAPIWNSKPAAAGKARNRIAAVFRWCIGRNHRLDNPMDQALAALPKVNGAGPEHYRALRHR